MKVSSIEKKYGWMNPLLSGIRYNQKAEKFENKVNDKFIYLIAIRKNLKSAVYVFTLGFLLNR